MEPLLALLTSADNGFGVAMWMEHNGRFLSVSCCFFFFEALHITIRVGWLRLLLPPRELSCGLVRLWLVAADAHFNCTYDVSCVYVHVYLLRRLRVRLRPPVSILRFLRLEG